MRYQLQKNWKESLHTAARHKAFLDAQQVIQVTEPFNLELYNNTTAKISGRVTKLYRINDEDSWDNAVLIENSALKKAWLVPLYYEPKDVLLNQDVTLQTKKKSNGRLVPVINIINKSKNISYGQNLP
jgi:hypothetical protein